MLDLGVRFGFDRSFCFDRLIVHDIVFDETSDVTLFCTIPYFGETYRATFGCTFDDLNTLLLAAKPASQEVAAALADKLKAKLEIPSIVELEKVFGGPLDITSCIIEASIAEVLRSDNENDEEEDPEEEEENDNPEEGEEDELDEDDDVEAYIFIIDDIYPRTLIE